MIKGREIKNIVCPICGRPGFGNCHNEILKYSFFGTDGQLHLSPAGERHFGKEYLKRITRTI